MYRMCEPGDFFSMWVRRLIKIGNKEQNVLPVTWQAEFRALLTTRCTVFTDDQTNYRAYGAYKRHSLTQGLYTHVYIFLGLTHRLVYYELSPRLAITLSSKIVVHHTLFFYNHIPITRLTPASSIILWPSEQLLQCLKNALQWCLSSEVQWWHLLNRDVLAISVIIIFLLYFVCICIYFYIIL